MSDESYGWWFPPGSREAHYLPGEGEMRSLCWRWGFLRAPAHGIFKPDNGPSLDDCKACRRKLEAVNA